MNQYINKSFLQQLILVLLGTFILSLGIHLIVVSYLGADAVSTFILGIMNYYDVQFGTVSLLINCAILVIVFIKQRSLIGWASVLNSFGIGIFLNLLDYMSLFGTDQLVLRIIYLLIGTELFALGTALYLTANAGSGAYECLMFIVQQWSGLSLRMTRISIDGTFMIAGLLLGAPFNIGTVIVISLLGPSIQLYLKLFEKIPTMNTLQNAN